MLVGHLLASAEAADAHHLASAGAGSAPPGLLCFALRQGALATAAAARHIARALQKKSTGCSTQFLISSPQGSKISARWGFAQLVLRLVK